MQPLPRSTFLFHLLVMSSPLASRVNVDAYPPADSLGENDELARTLDTSWSLSELGQGNKLEAERDNTLEKLQEIFGIRSLNEKSAHRKVPPQFMMELYNTIADPSGVTRGRNPYNAKVVRSFIERDTSMSHFYFFNISGLEVNESVLEAELHLYRKKTPTNTMHPSTVTSPYYLIRVYQVLDDRSLATPGLHRLLNVRYVGAHASGWQVFNVKQAVLAWVNGEPNLGLLVTASTFFEDEAIIEFSRRNEYHHSKQPILVLFDDDGKEHRVDTKLTPRYYTYDNNDENDADYQRTRDNQEGQSQEVNTMGKHEAEFFRRQKREHEEDSPPSWYDGGQESKSNDSRSSRNRFRREAIRSKSYDDKIISERTKIMDVLTSMDIYERAMLREMLNGRLKRRSRTRSSAIDRREKRSTTRKQSQATTTGQRNSTECSRHELYVDFNEIGLSSSIIAPEGYSAYHCKGLCESPLSQDQQPTNHATVQGIVHKMGLVKGVEMPCCVPTKLLSTSILFFDDNENVVLKMYEDMIADRCGCR